MRVAAVFRLRHFIKAYSGDHTGTSVPASLELLFRPRWNSCSGLAGTPVPAQTIAGIQIFLIHNSSGSKKS